MMGPPVDLPPVTLSEFDGVRYLHLGSIWVQGEMRIRKPHKVELDYVQRMLASLLWLPTHELGTGQAGAFHPPLDPNLPAPGSPVAGKEEIGGRCAKALYGKARELCDRKIVASEEECDLAFVFGIGFAMHLGGPIFYARTRGWA